jgi:hypothetical protein
MKKLLIICSAIGLMLFANACKKGLDPKIYGNLSTQNFPKTESDFTNYALEVYKPFQSKWGYSDPSGYQNTWFSPEFGDIMLFDYPSDQINIFTGYGGFFTAFSTADFSFYLNSGTSNHFEKTRFITRITQIIDDINKSSISDASKSLLTAEARMARAWSMYFLLQTFGPVPVIIDPKLLGTDAASVDAQNDLTRPPRLNFVKYIVDDLTYASNNLPRNAKDYGRFNKGLALTILMRTYMNEKDFVNGVKVGREILTLGYALVNDYASIFTEAGERNNETIWAVVCEQNQDGSENRASFNPWVFYNYPGDYPGNKVNASFAGADAPYSVTWDFYNSFDVNDKRRMLLLPSYNNKSNVLRNRANRLAGPVIAKYPDIGGNINSFQGNDIPKARLGSVMLLLAEAINQNSGPTAEAINLVNQVRLNHGGAAIGNVPSSATTNKPAFDQWILMEQGWDTYFEGQRKIDLVRHGVYNQALTAAGKIPRVQLLPIPNYLITAGKGKLVQNTGY